MTGQAQKNQAYLHWYFKMHEPQTHWAASEIRPQEIVREQAPHHPGEVERWIAELLGKPKHAATPPPGKAVNPWAFHGTAAGRGFMA